MNKIYIIYYQKFLVILVLLLLSKLKISSNENIVYFDKINNSIGLSSDKVNDILMDSEGYIWICTNNGLNRFDGYEMTVFKRQVDKENSFNGNVFSAICEDKNGRLWLGVNEGGLNIYDKNTGIVEIIDDDTTRSMYIEKGAFKDLLCDSKGRIWISTFYGIYVYKPEKNKIEFIKKTKGKNKNFPAHYSFTNIYEDSEGRIWLGVWGGGALMYHDKYDKVFHYKISVDEVVKGANLKKGWPFYLNDESDLLSLIWTFFEDNSGNFWIGTWERGLIKCRVEHDTLLQVNDYNYSEAGNRNSLVGNIVYDINEDNNNRLWAGTPNGLSIIDFSSDKPVFHNYYEGEGDYALSNMEVFRIFKSNSGEMWLSTAGGGAVKAVLDRKKILTYKLIDPGIHKISNNIHCFIVDNKNRLLVGVKSLGFCFYDTEKKSFKLYSEINPYKNIQGYFNTARCFHIDKNKNFWIGTRYNGIILLDSLDNIIKYELNRIQINCIKEDVDGNIWIGSSNGLYKFKSNNSTNDFKILSYRNNTIDSNSLSDNFVNTCFIDSKNQLWVITSDQVLHKVITDSLNSNDVIIKRCHQTYKNECKNKISCIFEDSEGEYYIGLEGKGLAWFDMKKMRIRQIFENHQFKNTTIYDIVEDNYGYLWLSGNNGITRFKHLSNNDLWIKNFNYIDGLQSNIFIQGAAYKQEDGNILFGGYRGFNLIKPESPKRNEFIPPVKITQLKITGKPVNILNKKDSIFILKYNQNEFSVKFAALSFSQPYKNKYLYRLKGYEDNWILNSADKREIHYTNLPPGKYTFEVKGSNNDGVWNEDGTLFKVHIKPPFWRTYWFITGSIFLIIILIFAIYKNKVKKIKHRNARLTNLVNEKTKEVKLKNEILEQQTTDLNETNAELEEQQQYIEELAEELSAHKEKLAIENKKLVEINAMKDKFFSIIGHDLKNPLNVIIGFSDLLYTRLENIARDKEMKYYKNINDSAKRTYKLLENLLDWARSQTGKMKYMPAELLFNKILLENINLHLGMCKSKNIIIESEITDDIIVDADQHMVDAIVRNLVSNAVKFTSSGGRITISAKNTKNNGFVEISIKDSGIGIPSGSIENIFRIDKSYNRTGTEGESGTGLGLLLCKEFIEKHNGKIRVESSEGKGSVFSFTLPLIKETEYSKVI